MTIEMRYLWSTEEMEFTVEMPDKTYLSLGFGGEGMYWVDMLAWFADSETGHYVQDYWSFDKREPKVDDTPDFNVVEVTDLTETNRVKFITTRSLDTGDVKEDFLI